MKLTENKSVLKSGAEIASRKDRSTTKSGPEIQPLPAMPSPQDSSAVLALLEADQVVAAKQRTRFGRRELSVRIRAALWALRLYVVVMLVLVLISVLRGIHSAP